MTEFSSSVLLDKIYAKENNNPFVEEEEKTMNEAKDPIIEDRVSNKFEDPDNAASFCLWDVWDFLNDHEKAVLMLTRQNKKIMKQYGCFQEELSPVGKEIVNCMHDHMTLKECNSVASVMVAFHTFFENKHLEQMYIFLSANKTAKKAIQTIGDCFALSQKLNMKLQSVDGLSEVEQLVHETLVEEKKSTKEVEATFKKMYNVSASVLPKVFDLQGKRVSSFVLAWLLTAHETMGYDYPRIKYNRAEIRPEAQEVLAQLNANDFQSLLKHLADTYLGLNGRNKKCYLSYPICRYANETLIEELCKKAPSWRSKMGGNSTPSFAEFLRACCFNNTKTALLFVDRYGWLEEYARIRKIDVDVVREQYLSDVGLDENGGKQYDLGNQVVTARLQSNLSFVVELENGKTSKSLPKKNADEGKYKIANADFTALKKQSKEIVKNSKNKLLEDFLSGRRREATTWQTAYCNNPLLKSIAQLLVWQQGKVCFTMGDDGCILADGTPYTLTEESMCVAHPMEMENATLLAWQQYFTTNGLKQPFEQVWEPVIDGLSVESNRYEGVLIPFYRFKGREKHGIVVKNYDFYNDIEISFKACNALVERIDWERHYIDMNHNFEVKNFSFKTYTRQVNHIVAYLDRCTVYNRILNDDVSLAQYLHSFTLAQITEFVKLASENNCPNATAILLEYQQKNFPEFDPMAEFIFD